MACYTLGPGWGTIPMIGSHNKFHGNVIRFKLFLYLKICFPLSLQIGKSLAQLLPQYDNYEL